jgi:predicted secreted protein
MSSNAIETQGTTLGINTSGAPTVYTTIPEIKDFSGPGGQAAVIDVTSLSSTGKEKRMGLQDEGQLSFNIFYVPDNAQHTALRAARAARAKRGFKLTFTDATVWTFDAYVTSFSVSGAVDGVIEAAVTLEITGAITEA